MPREGYIPPITGKRWLHTLVKPILVVGNSVLDRPVPEEEYQSVVRINNYCLGGLSGNKVTHWVANGYQSVMDRPIRPVLVPWSLKCEELRGNPGQVFFERVQGKVIYLVGERHIRWWFPSAAFRGKNFPTTGFCFLAWLIAEKIRPDIAGFDGMKTGHQGDPSFQHGHDKTRDREWHLIRKWGLRRR